MTGQDVKRQVMEALEDAEPTARNLDEAYLALHPCTVLTPEEREKVRAILEHADLTDYDPNANRWHLATVSADDLDWLLALLTDEAGDECVCGEINMRHCPVHANEGDLPHDPSLTGRSSGGGRLGDGSTDNFVTYAPHTHYKWEEDTAAAALQGRPNRQRGDVTLIAGSAVRRLTPTECERLQALPDGWTNPTGTAPDSRRYAALGDAVTASVAEWIGRRLMAA